MLGGRPHKASTCTHKDSKWLTKALVGEVSSCLRKIGCRCVLNEQIKNQCRSKLLNIQCVNTEAETACQKWSGSEFIKWGVIHFHSE